MMRFCDCLVRRIPDHHGRGLERGVRAYARAMVVGHASHVAALVEGGARDNRVSRRNASHGEGEWAMTFAAVSQPRWQA